jgi:WD40 repeat protein
VDLTLVHLQKGLPTEKLSVTHTSAWDSAPLDHRLALGTVHGQAYVIAIGPPHIASHDAVCQGRVSGIKFLPRQSRVAYACKEGTIGTWDLQTGAIVPRVHLEGHADRIAVSSDGDYIIAAGGNGTVTVVDLVTEIATSYKGHSFRLMAISPPSPRYPFLLSGDVRGALRAWPLPKRYARVVAHVHRPFQAAFFSGDALVTTTMFPELTTYSVALGVRNASPHLYDATHIAWTADRHTFATYGSNDSVEVWSASELSRKRVVATNHGMVSQIDFVDDAGTFVSAGRDGRLVLRGAAGETTELAQLPKPIEAFALGPIPRSAIMISSDGGLWRTTGKGPATPLNRGAAAFTRISWSPDRRSMYVSDAKGNVSVIDAITASQTPILDAGDAIENLSLDHDGRLIALSSNNGIIHIGIRTSDGSTGPAFSWSRLHARARDIAFTQDGMLIAACTDGSILIYSPAQREVLYMTIGTVDLTHVAVSSDTTAVAVVDTEGRIVWLDLNAVRATIEKTKKAG